MAQFDIAAGNLADSEEQGRQRRLGDPGVLNSHDATGTGDRGDAAAKSGMGGYAARSALLRMRDYCAVGAPYSRRVRRSCQGSLSAASSLHSVDRALVIESRRALRELGSGTHSGTAERRSISGIWTVFRAALLRFGTGRRGVLRHVSVPLQRLTCGAWPCRRLLRRGSNVAFGPTDVCAISRRWVCRGSCTYDRDVGCVGRKGTGNGHQEGQVPRGISEGASICSPGAGVTGRVAAVRRRLGADKSTKA